uniref:Otogelin like n=1 Tax=Cynoglossus semilaevis TaxID=244447 RepID=A0A3P8UUH2_CYNSE
MESVRRLESRNVRSKQMIEMLKSFSLKKIYLFVMKLMLALIYVVCTNHKFGFGQMFPCLTFLLRSFLVPNQGQDRDGICRSWGQHHYETFDGIYFYFPGTCSYILAQDCHSSTPQYTVWVHNSRVCDGSVYSCARALSLFFPNEEEIYISGYQVHQGGRRLILPQTIGSVFIERLADYLLVKSAFGFSLAWDGGSGVYLKMSEEHQDSSCGLCGNFNHFAGDDLLTALFANSWAVDLPHERACPSVDLDFTGPCQSESDINKCSALLFFPFLSCHENIDPNPFVASCISDLCISDDEETFCRALVEYTRACSHVGYPVREWRDSFPSCNDGCEDSFVYRDCISCCPPTCRTNLHCLDGCYCPDGLILQNGTCIAVSQCPCVYHGTSYMQGHELHQGCSVCVCFGGVWNCTENNCTGRTVTVSRQITLTRDGEVIIDNNIFVDTFNNVFFLFLFLFGYIDTVEVRKLTSVFVQLKVADGLRLQYDSQGGRVYLQLHSKWRGQTLGLCGTFNGNLRDDFLSPAGMIEGTPQLHANAWKVSSACAAPVNLPVIDPCEMNQNNVYYASQCDTLMGSVFAPCHGYISPNIYQQQCRYQSCRCGSSCLCTALAHYTYLCSKHGVVVDFRSQVSECAVCLGGMLYHSCVSFCGRSCRALSDYEECDSADCAEGCGCPESTFYDDVRQRCVQKSQCHCYTMAGAFQPGEVSFSASEPEEVGECQEGKVYNSCIDQRGGMACAPTCRNLMLNLTCPPNTPCIPGCVCPPGLLLHHGKCYYPENCPCAWLGLEYLPGETIETLCYKCVCHRGYFNCSYSQCPSVCTIYSDRHYHTFDGLEYDYYSDCQVYLLKSTGDTEVSIVAQNKDCYESGIVCRKLLIIHVGLSKIYFTDNSGNPVRHGSEFELWKAGYYTVVQFSNQDLTILWDRKTTVHIRVGPQWKGRLGGLCGNFDGITVNDMSTSSHMEVSNAQAFGDSWTLGQCESDYVVERPCERDLGRQPYAKRECALLYSDVFAPCHNVVDVGWFYRNCLTDTCNCNRGGDCECLCTSIAAYAHKCCQQGVTIHWRSPSVCPYDCEYYNRELGDGPFSLASASFKDTMLGVNRTSGTVFPLTVERPGQLPASGLLFNFMITAGLHRDRTSSELPVVSLESAERPNFFLAISGRGPLHLEHWSQDADFSTRATFIQHQGLFQPGHTSFELFSQPGTFLTLTHTSAQPQRYDTSDTFRTSSSFTLEESSFVIPYRMMCEWRYQPCANPCVRTCRDPDAKLCQFLPLVEGCFPRCPKTMVLDEVTRRCVYPDDCKYNDYTFLEPNLTRSCMTVTTPPYSHRIDECAELICFNGELLLHNSSLHCRYNTSQPHCSLLGLPILINTDPCCPLWQCPCRCTVMSDLRVITFDGNNAALYDNGSYILVNLPRETIIGSVEKCPTSQSPTGGTSGLCFKKLNITTSSYRIIINRLERKVTVNYRPVSLPFSRHFLHVEDTGSMYLIHTSHGIDIQWYHSTGIMVLQYKTLHNGFVATQGLCGCCDGNPEDDLKLPNGTVIKDVGDMMLFLQSWSVYTTDEIEHTRKVGANCTTGDCSTCLSMLHQRTFSPCHSKVSPEQFCDIMWAGDLHYKDHQCDFLAAYVAVCYTHQICINWRRHNFCPLQCPPGKEYQPCVSTCASRTCLNREYYDETSCSFIREECVCRSGTILHRPDSPYCVTEDRCVCTDNEGNPRAPGEVWNGSSRGCCLYKCAENGSVVAVEPECNSFPTPLCEREGEYVLDVVEEGACCPKKICECNMTVCDREVPPCENGNRLVIGYSTLSCCPEYRCECDPMACPPISPPHCRQDQFLVEVRGHKSCCYSYLCVCESCTEPIPSCSHGEILSVDLNTTNSCCPQYYCVCDVNLCPESSVSCAAGLSLVQTHVPGLCCPQYHCGTHKQTLISKLPSILDVLLFYIIFFLFFFLLSLPILISVPFFTYISTLVGTLKTFEFGTCPFIENKWEKMFWVFSFFFFFFFVLLSFLFSSQVTVYSCDGKCPSATIFNFNINSHARFCKCCRENGLQTRSVTLYCSRNSTVVEYNFQEPLECTCQWH